MVARAQSGKCPFCDNQRSFGRKTCGLPSCQSTLLEQCKSDALESLTRIARGETMGVQSTNDVVYLEYDGRVRPFKIIGRNADGRVYARPIDSTVMFLPSTPCYATIDAYLSARRSSKSAA
jgi:hypothetical protein